MKTQLTMFRTRLVGDGKKALKALSLTLAIQLMLPASGMAQSPATVDLGTASSFVVLAAAGISNTGASTMLDGDIGSYPTTTITGLDESNYTGVNHGGDETTQAAMIALNAAYVDAAGRSSTTIASELGGTERTTGVYSAGTLGLTGTLTLSGSATDVFIFQAASTLITGVSSHVVLTGGAVWSNVFWKVGSSATIGGSSTFQGTILANTSITVNSGATINNGRLLAGAVTATGAVVLNANDVSLPVTLSEFNLELVGGSVHLSWTTSAEIENLGFNIQRQEADGEWLAIANFTEDKELAGYGSTTEEHRYDYTDSKVTAGSTYGYRLQDVDYAGKTTTHDDWIRTITVPAISVYPKSFALAEAYPNPFNPSTRIPFIVQESGNIRLEIFDLAGQPVETLLDEVADAGEHSVDWQPTAIASGIYLVRLSQGQNIASRKLMYLK